MVHQGATGDPIAQRSHPDIPRQGLSVEQPSRHKKLRHGGDDPIAAAVSAKNSHLVNPPIFRIIPAQVHTGV